VWWRVRTTGPKFALTAAVCGTSTVLALRPTPALAGAVMVAAAGKLLLEGALFLHLRRGEDSDLARTALLLTGHLATATRWRFALGTVGGLGLPLLVAFGVAPVPLAAAALAAVLAGELVERSQFFRAVVAPRMPGPTP